MRFWIGSVVVWVVGMASGQGTRGVLHAGGHTRKNDWKTILENPARDAYQQPEVLLDWIEKEVGTLKGRKVYDLGAGTGYFSWRMVRRGATVIAVDIEDSLLHYMERRRDSLGISPQQWLIRKVSPQSPDLKPGEAEWAFLADVYHHLSERVEYLRKLRASLPEGGRLLIVEWAPRETPVGPPLHHRLFPTQVENELKKAGFAQIRVEEHLLPYHYIVVAKR